MLEHLPTQLLPTTASVALALLAEVSRRLQRDTGGYKVGATAPAALNRTDSLSPMLGIIPRLLTKTSPAVFDRAGFICPVVEFEIAFHMAEDLPSRCDA